MNRQISTVIKLGIIVFIGFSSGFAYYSSPNLLINENLAKQGDDAKQLELGMYYLKAPFSPHYRCAPRKLSTAICEKIETLINKNEIQSTSARGIYWLRKSSKVGNIEAKYQLALALQRYSDNNLSTRNSANLLNESIELLEQLVINGHAGANYQLGWYHMRGIGVDVDYQRAINYLKVARHKNHPKAESLLEIAEREYKANKSFYLTGAENAPPS